MIATRFIGGQGDLTQVGDWRLSPDKKAIIIWLPVVTLVFLHIYPTEGYPKTPFWTWNESTDKPTLTPSIDAGQWHGFLTDGNLIDA